MRLSGVTVYTEVRHAQFSSEGFFLDKEQSVRSQYTRTNSQELLQHRGHIVLLVPTADVTMKGKKEYGY
jgi:hypothetical protein